MPDLKMIEPSPVATSRHRVLYGVFLVGYVLLSLMVVEQGRIIENQKVLIRSLFFDSLQLSAMKVQQVIHPSR